MRFVLGIALAASLLGTAAQAQQQPNDNSREIKISTSVICDTKEQMERFVTVFDGNAEKALHTVNTEANSRDACVVATIAYVVGNELGKASNKEGTFQIVQVLVVGMATPAGFQAVVPAPFVSLVRVNEISV
jgi:hypothetical protein